MKSTIIAAIITLCAAVLVAGALLNGADADVSAAPGVGDEVTVPAATPGPAIGFRHQPRITARTGQSFLVEVVVDNAADLYGWQLAVTANSNYLRLDRIVAGPFLRSDRTNTYFAPPVMHSTSTTNWAKRAAETRLSVNEGVWGNGSIAWVYLTALKATSGTTVTINPSGGSPKLVDRNAQDLTLSFTNGGDLTVAIGDTVPPYYPFGVSLPFVRR
jgi:hypothetical protein